jgi:hypothetical protein
MHSRWTHPPAANPYLSYYHPIESAPSYSYSPRTRNPDRHKSFILYTEMSKDGFLHWWLPIEQCNKQGSPQVNADDSENVKKLHWDGTGNTSDIWTRFKQAASYSPAYQRLGRHFYILRLFSTSR